MLMKAILRSPVTTIRRQSAIQPLSRHKIPNRSARFRDGSSKILSRREGRVPLAQGVSAFISVNLRLTSCFVSPWYSFVGRLAHAFRFFSRPASPHNPTRPVVLARGLFQDA